MRPVSFILYTTHFFFGMQVAYTDLYHKGHPDALEKAVESDCGKTLRRILVSLLQAHRDQSSTTNAAKAAQDVHINISSLYIGFTTH